MKAKSAFTTFSWLFLVLGLIGLAGAIVEDAITAGPALTVLGFGFAGLGFRAYLDSGLNG